MRYGTETAPFLGPKICNILPIEYKETAWLHKFKKKTSNYKTDECPSRLSKTYIQRVGFI